jgi:hypothetical protein
LNTKETNVSSFYFIFYFLNEIKKIKYYIMSSYYSITLDGQIYSHKIGYFTTINIYSDNMDEALNKAIVKVRKNVLKKYKFYTDKFMITDIEKLDFMGNESEYYFYNL